MHDNTVDKYQLENIADEHPDLVSELRDEMNGWLKQNNDPWLEG